LRLINTLFLASLTFDDKGLNALTFDDKGLNVLRFGGVAGNPSRKKDLAFSFTYKQ
jgi:hypothetical protein